MGNICHYVEILIFMCLYRPSEAATQNYSDDYYFRTQFHAPNEYPVLRVFNGKKADLAEFPYQIAFKKPLSGELFTTFCGGGLIGKKKILSAAHCFVMDANWCEKNCAGNDRAMRLENRYAVGGTLKTTETRYRFYRQQWRPLSQAFVPPTYAYPKDDLAIVFTARSFLLDEFVNVIPYARDTMDYGKLSCNVTGYGKLNASMPSEYLMWATLFLISTPECTTKHNMNMDKFICTETGYTDVMEGDSGGPLVCLNTGDSNDLGNGVIVGIVTGSTKPGGTFFTRISSYSHYIATNNHASISTINFICVCILISYYIKFIL